MIPIKLLDCDSITQVRGGRGHVCRWVGVRAKVRAYLCGRGRCGGMLEYS